MNYFFLKAYDAPCGFLSVKAHESFASWTASRGGVSVTFAGQLRRGCVLRCGFRDIILDMAYFFFW